MLPMMPEESVAPAAPPGSRYLIDIVLHRIDPSQPDPGLPEPPEVTGEEERGFAVIRREMAQKLRSHLRDYNTLNPEGIFVLNDHQDRTLEGLGLPRSTRDAVRSLNCLMYQVQRHHTNERLEVIGSIPPTPEDGMPNWQQWWLDNIDSRIGVRAHLNRDPDPAEKTLDSVVAAIARDAAPHLPGTAVIARCIAQGEEKKGRSGKTEKARRAGWESSKPKLSQVWVFIQKLAQLADGIGMDPGRTMTRWTRTPEGLLAELRREIPGFRQDMGRLGSIEELRAIVRENGIGQVQANGNGLWHDRDAEESWRISGAFGPRPEIMELPELPEKTGPGPEEPADELSEAETELMELSAPPHPAISRTYQCVTPQDTGMAVIALVNRVTPKHAREYLAGLSDNPRPSGPPGCPQAERCRSWCGRLQARGEMPFALTDDGGHESCGYFRFLAQHGGMTPSQREIHAGSRLEQARREWQRAARKNQGRNPRKIETVGLHVPNCELSGGWLSCSHLHKQHKGEQPLLACGHPAFARNSHSLFYRGLLRAKAGQSAGVETLTPSVHLPMLPHPRQRPPPSRGSFAQLPDH